MKKGFSPKKYGVFYNVVFSIVTFLGAGFLLYSGVYFSAARGGAVVLILFYIFYMYQVYLDRKVAPKDDELEAGDGSIDGNS